MEKLEGRYKREFFIRTTCEKREQILAFIKDNKQKIRNCYSETCELDNHDYVMMILRDAIFVIELLLRNFEEDERDFLLVIPAEKNALRLDLQLLENQLPYFLLEGLYKLVISSPSFMHLCFKFFEDQMFDSVPEETVFKHFTNLRRSALVKSYPKQKFEYPEIDLPCAAKLHESGVKFKAVHKTDQCLLDIKFEVDELRIPHLKVYDETETILRNIMAVEQCLYPDDTRVCSYIELINGLIDTKKDMNFFADAGIISHFMVDDASVANMFNRLSLYIHTKKPSYYAIRKDLKEHYKNPSNHTKAAFILWFDDPLKSSGTFLAVFTVVLTLIQTIISIIGAATGPACCTPC